MNSIIYNSSVEMKTGSKAIDAEILLWSWMGAFIFLVWYFFPLFSVVLMLMLLTIVRMHALIEKLV